VLIHSPLLSGLFFWVTGIGAVSHKHYYQQAQQNRAVTLVEQKTGALFLLGAETTTFPLSGANKPWNYFKAATFG
jgi:hypothetical protein